MTGRSSRRVTAPDVRDLLAATLGLPATEPALTRLAARVKQVQRFDWPASLKDDPDVRRGYTLEQCLKIALAMLLQDAFIPATVAIRMARENHGQLLGLAAAFLEQGQNLATTEISRSSSSLYFIAFQGPADGDQSPFPEAGDPGRLRVVDQGELSHLWPGTSDLSRRGSRTIIDMPGAFTAFFSFLRQRDLISTMALEEFAFFARQTALTTAAYERFGGRVADRYRY